MAPVFLEMFNYTSILQYMVRVLAVYQHTMMHPNALSSSWTSVTSTDGSLVGSRLQSNLKALNPKPYTPFP